MSDVCGWGFFNTFAQKENKDNHKNMTQKHTQPTKNNAQKHQ
jgi:hypothetical protein